MLQPSLTVLLVVLIVIAVFVIAIAWRGREWFIYLDQRLHWHGDAGFVHLCGVHPG